MNYEGSAVCLYSAAPPAHPHTHRSSDCAYALVAYSVCMRVIYGMLEVDAREQIFNLRWTVNVTA